MTMELMITNILIGMFVCCILGRICRAFKNSRDNNKIEDNLNKLDKNEKR